MVAAVGAWSAEISGPRWIPAENLHVTMRFLGAVDDERIPAVADAIAMAVGDFVDLAVTLGAAGAFPSSKRARVLWVGVDDPAGGLAAMVEMLDEQLAGLGFPREDRLFRAHITVARAPVPVAVFPDRISVEPVRFTVERLTLFRSHLGGGKPARYEALSTFPFRRPLTRPRPDDDA